MRTVFLASILLIASIGLANASDYMGLFNDNRITKDELANVIADYMLGSSRLSLDEIRDASYVYIHWSGEPKSIVDSANRTITIYKPIKRIVALHSDAVEASMVLGAKDKVVGVSKYTKESKRQFPELSELPSVGSCFDPDIEAVVSLNPDVVISYVRWPDSSKLEEKLELLGLNIAVIRLDFYKGSTMKEEMEKLGYLLDKEKNASKYIEWFEKYENLVKSRTPEKRVKVYTCGKPLRAFGEGTGLYDLSVMAEGKNILEGREGYFDVDPEQVIVWAPEVILRWSYAGGYETNDISGMKTEYEEIVYKPGFKNVPAVKNNRVYVMSADLATAPSFPAALVTVAKWLYPDRYSDTDPREIFQEYIDNFLHINYNVSEQGSFVYPKW
ncbi:hypothetical protein DRO97_00360 [Archaeoglobales archaeon]|nr:MAG: hypothetical protein DRO97_00360 [Archaeoglobales archaeon]